MWKFSNKANFDGNLSTKQISVEILPQIQFVVEIFQLSKLLWKFSNKASFCGNVQASIFLLRFSNQEKLCGNFTIKQHTFLWKFRDKTAQILWHLAPQNSVKLWRNFATKQSEFWWTFPQNQPNCQNFHAAMLPRCKGFCDSAGPLVD